MSIKVSTSNTTCDSARSMVSKLLATQPCTMCHNVVVKLKRYRIIVSQQSTYLRQQRRSRCPSLLHCPGGRWTPRIEYTTVQTKLPHQQQMRRECTPVDHPAATETVRCTIKASIVNITIGSSVNCCHCRSLLLNDRQYFHIGQLSGGSVIFWVSSSLVVLAP